MDCVTCEKCRVWGKLQILGLGTAIKILMSSEEELSAAATALKSSTSSSSSSSSGLAIFSAFYKNAKNKLKLKRFF